MQSVKTNRRDLLLKRARQTLTEIEKEYMHNPGLLAFYGKPVQRLIRILENKDS